MLRRYWFPLALVGLLLLALPGFALFALDLFGHEGRANQWLQERFGLSHHVPLTDGAALLLFLVPFGIILLYFLRLKRKAVPVPSTFLWKKSVEDLHVNRLMQWLRRNVLLLLQLLVILTLLYAIIGPRLHGVTQTGRHYILMIDNSASMSAADGADGETRLEWAKREALKEIDAATDADFGMVIVFNSAAEIRQSYTSNRALLRSAVENVKPTQRPTRIDEALSLAESLANPLRSTEDEAARPPDAEPGKERTYVPVEGIPTEVHLYSDGRFPDVPGFALANLNLRFHLAGTENRADNVGIVNFDAVRDEADPRRLQVYARVLNFRDRPANVTLRLDVYAGGELRLPLDRSVEVPARAPDEAADPSPPSQGGAEGGNVPPPLKPGERGIFFDLADVEVGADVRMHLRLDGVEDAFPLDDEAWLVLGIVRKARVLIVGPGNPVLSFFFDANATRKVAEVTYLPPEKLSDDEAYLDPARSGAFDLVIFDRCAPAREEDMPRAHTFFVGRPPPPWDHAMLEKVEFPQVRGWSDEHAVMRGLRGWHELEIAEAFRLPELPPRTPRLLEGDRNLVLMAALSRGPYTDLVLAFPLETADAKWNTRWFLRPLFPLFLRNLLYAMGNVRDATTEEPVRPGEIKRLLPEGGVGQVRVRTPGGVSVELERGGRAEFAFGGTEEVGVYEVRWGGERRHFAVNLFDDNESNLEPRPALRIGDERVTAGEDRRQPRELWKWLVLAGLALLMLEWYVYNRRVYV